MLDALYLAPVTSIAPVTSLAPSPLYSPRYLSGPCRPLYGPVILDWGRPFGPKINLKIPIKTLPFTCEAA